MVKPRIKLLFEGLWQCYGGDVSGCGFSPANAYYYWRVNKMNYDRCMSIGAPT